MNKLPYTFQFRAKSLKTNAIQIKFEPAGKFTS